MLRRMLVYIARLYNQSIELYRVITWSFAGEERRGRGEDITAYNSTNIQPISMYLGLTDRGEVEVSTDRKYIEVI